MAKEPTFETHPELFHLPPGVTEPQLKNPESAGVDVIKKEPADKAGPVGASDEKPKAAKPKGK